MKAIYYYFVGLSQGLNLPRWLPLFITCEYLGNNTYKWFGIKIKTKSFGGETLFMYWRRILLERIIMQKVIFKLAIFIKDMAERFSNWLWRLAER